MDTAAKYSNALQPFEQLHESLSKAALLPQKPVGTAQVGTPP